jgi:hypothetical protein
MIKVCNCKNFTINSSAISLSNNAATNSTAISMEGEWSNLTLFIFFSIFFRTRGVGGQKKFQQNSKSKKIFFYFYFIFIIQNHFFEFLIWSSNLTDSLPSNHHRGSLNETQGRPVRHGKQPSLGGSSVATTGALWFLDEKTKYAL